MHAFPLAARRIRRQARSSDSVLVLEKICALVLPATPFSGAQALATRLALLLVDIPCELRVYHGATALLVMQHLREAGAQSLALEGGAHTLAPVARGVSQANSVERSQEIATSLPYLAFLGNYPPPRLLCQFPYELACRYQCVPLGTARRSLTLAAYHRLNRETLAQVGRATCREIFQVRCEATVIDEVFRYWQRIRGLPDLDTVGLKRDEICHSSR